MLFPTEHIVWLNIAIIVVIALFTYSGYRQGFLIKIFGCIAFIVSGFVAWFLSYPLAYFFSIYPKDLTPLKGTIVEPVFYAYMNRILLFIILLVIFSIFVICLKSILQVLNKIPVIHIVNSWLGIGFGFLQGVVCIVLVSVIFITPIFANGKAVIEESYLKPFANVVDYTLFFAQDTLQQLKSIQKIVTPSTILENIDYDSLQKWLENADLPANKIQEFLLDLKGE